MGIMQKELQYIFNGMGETGMQVKAVALNAANMAAGWNRQGNGNQVQPGDSIFGAECKVTISRKGRELGRQQAEEKEKDAGCAKAERMLLRQQEESRLNEDMKRSYREKLKELEDTADYLNHSYNKKKDMDTVEKEQAVREAMRSQKQFQMEENMRRAREAQQMAMQSGEYQKEIDENNRDLLTLLKTMEAAEEAGDGQENSKAEAGGAETGNGKEVTLAGRNQSLGFAGDTIQKSAVQFTVASMIHAGGVDEAIAGLNDEGHQFLDRADSVTRGVFRESEGIRTALEDDGFTDEEIAGMMKDFQEKMPFIYKSMEDDRGRGLQNLQDAQECRIQHLGDDPLGGMAETKKSMMVSAIEAAYGEVVQDGINEVSRKLKDEVEKLLDERNDIGGIQQEEEEEKQEQEELTDEVL